jgi:hypothetical protein
MISQIFTGLKVDDILIRNGNITDNTLLKVMYHSNRHKLFWNQHLLSCPYNEVKRIERIESLRYSLCLLHITNIVVLYGKFYILKIKLPYAIIYTYINVVYVLLLNISNY